MFYFTIIHYENCNEQFKIDFPRRLTNEREIFLFLFSQLMGIVNFGARNSCFRIGVRMTRNQYEIVNSRYPSIVMRPFYYVKRIITARMFLFNFIYQVNHEALNDIMELGRMLENIQSEFLAKQAFILFIDE